MGVITSIIAAAVAVGGTAKSAIDSRKAKKAGQRANAAQVKANRIKNAQQKRAFLRKFQQAQAAALAGGIAAGVGIESSLTQGLLSGQATQKAVQIAEFKELDTLGETVLNQRQSQANFQSSSAIFGQVAGFASKFVNFADFKKPPVPPPPATT